MSLLSGHRLVAILRARNPAPLLDVARTLIDAGVSCLEIPLPTPGSLDAVRSLALDGVFVGVGTVLTVEDVAVSVEAGARFIVSPNTDVAVIRAAKAAGIGSLPGAFTPTEVLAAWREEPTAVKLFPADALSPGFVAALRGPLPDVPLVPTGGIGVEDVEPYLAAGAVAVGVGSPLVGDALAGGSLAELRARALDFVSRLGG